mmetsp:Transcript_11439/g.18712  ORF Transcript_11439/g.18712 Transcript_11439/m.18712 type:complete len:212 (-) Transcript_11439:18-653(-)
MSPLSPGWLLAPAVVANFLWKCLAFAGILQATPQHSWASPAPRRGSCRGQRTSPPPSEHPRQIAAAVEQFQPPSAPVAVAPPVALFREDPAVGCPCHPRGSSSRRATCVGVPPADPLWSSLTQSPHPHCKVTEFEAPQTQPPSQPVAATWVPRGSLRAPQTQDEKDPWHEIHRRSWHFPRTQRTELRADLWGWTPKALQVPGMCSNHGLHS